VLFLLGWYFSTLDPVSGLPLFGFLSALCIALGGAFLTPAVLFALGRAGKTVLRRAFKVEGLLAHANLAGSIPRLNISVAALAVSLSMMVAIAVMIGSFRQTVIYWVGQTLEADLFISPAGEGRNGTSNTISEVVENVVRSHPRVVAIDRFHRREIPYRDSLIWLGIGDFPVRLQWGGLQFKEPSDGRRAMEAAIGEDAVLVSESFALKQGQRVGDSIILPTTRGKSRFRIAAIYFDYSSDRGIVVMDRSTAERHYGVLKPTSLAVYLQKGSDPDQTRSSILNSLDRERRISVYTNAAIRREVLRVFDSTFAITYALEVIAIFIAILGVAATLVTLILERRRDLAVLRLMGADRRQVRKMVVIEAALMGTASQGIGLAVGLALSLLLIYVINVQSFGWTIQFRLPLFFLAQMSLLVMLATTLSGLYPAYRACALPSVEQVVEE
jgi:putative ABC transport system permease protein